MAFNTPIQNWSGRVVWVVGASSGIGLAVAKALADKGAYVAVSARSAEPLNAFVMQTSHALALPVDVTDAQAVRQAADQLRQHYGRLDQVVYCAGIYKSLRATEFDLDVLSTHWQVNYQGALHVLNAVLAGFNQAKSGLITLVSSVAGFAGLPQSLAYGPTKAALSHLAEILYLDLVGAGIGVSVVHPGFVETPLTAQNQFPMPAMVSTAQAAQAILQGWESGRFEIHFPRRFTWAMKVLRCLPYRLRFALVRRITGL